MSASQACKDAITEYGPIAISSPACVGDGAKKIAGTVTKSVAETIMDAVAGWFSDGLTQIVKALSTFWIDVKTPSVGDTSGNPSDTIAWMWDHLGWLSAALCVMSVLIGAINIALQHNRGEQKQTLEDIVKTVLLFAVLGVFAVGLVAALTAFADQFSNWLIDQSTDGDFGTNFASMLAVGSVASGGIGVIIIILVGIFAILASCFQVVLMVIRSAMIVLLMGALPLIASTYGTAAGKQWLKKALAWLLAFILYKPAASIIYATAFRLLGDKSIIDDPGDAIISFLMGTALMFLALLALPALMRFIVPAVGVAAASGGGGVLAGFVGAAVASGAVVAAAGSSGASGASPGSGGQSGSDGAAGGAGPSAGGSGGASGPGGSSGPEGGPKGPEGGDPEGGPSGGGPGGPPGGGPDSGADSGGDGQSTNPPGSSAPGGASAPAGNAMPVASGVASAVGAARVGADRAVGADEAER